MIYITSFMNIGTGVQAILMFCLGNLRSCNVGITDGSIHEDWYWHSKVNRRGGDTHTHTR
jgi:hypothetical protein